MTNDTAGPGQTTISSDVEVSRDVVDKEQGLIGTLEIRSHRDDRVVVHVVDEFPADLPIEAVAFKPDSEPETGEITTDRASIKQPVGDDPVRIVYGIQLSDRPDTPEFDPPTIRTVEAVDFNRGSTSEQQYDEQSGDPTDDTDDSGGILSKVHEKLNPSSAASPEEMDEQPTRSKTDGGTESASTEESDTEESHPGEIPIEQALDNLEEVEDWNETEDDSARNDDEDETNENNAQPMATEKSVHQEAADESDTENDDEHEETFNPSETRLEESDSPMARSIEVRLDRLSARVEEFAAYAAALEGVLDEHGTAEEFVGRFERDLDDLERRLDTVREDVESARDEHEADVDDLEDAMSDIESEFEDVRAGFESDIESVREELDSVEDTVDRVGMKTRRLETRANQQESDVESVSEDVESLEGRIDSLEDDLGRVRESVQGVEQDISGVSSEVRALRDELEGVRNELEDLRGVHDTLARAFGGGPTGAETASESDTVPEEDQVETLSLEPTEGADETSSGSEGGHSSDLLRDQNDEGRPEDV